MKGLSKYVNDSTRRISIELLGEEYKGILSNKMKVNEFLVKERYNRLHLNQELCEVLRNDKDKIDLIIYEALQGVLN